MTITLHWWIVPVLIAAIGLFFVVKAWRAPDVCFGGFIEGFIAIGFFLMALAVVVGHFL